MTANADTDVLVGIGMVEALAGMYLAGHDPRDPLVAPIHGEYTGLPPIHIQVGDAETLLDDTIRVAEVARAADVDVTVEVFPSMQHVFQFGAGTVPESDAALARAADFLRRQLGLQADLHLSASGTVRS